MATSHTQTNLDTDDELNSANLTKASWKTLSVLDMLNQLSGQVDGSPKEELDAAAAAAAAVAVIMEVREKWVDVRDVGRSRFRNGDCDGDGDGNDDRVHGLKKRKVREEAAWKLPVTAYTLLCKPLLRVVAWAPVDVAIVVQTAIAEEKEVSLLVWPKVSVAEFEAAEDLQN
ncbi:hypothetical protein HK102_001706 [Quaeritorhiza haematococci]|nr:hypothetical protein HK102_001706 [Quaeritorhiza haematococci]